jgi:phage tail sheath protein FI
MSSELLGSKIVVTEEQPRIRQIQGVPTGVFGMVGITEMGPVGERIRSTSFDEWLETFGSAIADGDAYHAVLGFFQNGGQVLDFVRTVHYTNPDTPSTKTSLKADHTIQTTGGGVTQGTVLGTVAEPFDLVTGDTLDIETDAGGPTTATITATAASLECASAETYALADGQTLIVGIDGGTPVTVIFNTAEFVDIANATAEEVAAVINAELPGMSATVTSGGTKVTITSDTEGTDSEVHVTGGTANTALGFSTSAASGGGNVADIDAVTVAEIKTIVELAVSGVTVTDESGYVRITRDVAGAAAWVRVNATSTADDELGLDNAQHYGSSGAAVDTLKIEAKWDGTYAHDFTIVIARATSREAEKFNLKVLDNGIVVEVWPNLTMDSASADYVETRMNNADTGSKYVQAVDLAASGTATERRPSGGDVAPNYTETTHGPLTGGDDGLTSLADTDFIGSSAGPTGFYVLNSSLDLAIIACPDRPTSAVENFLVSYAEDVRDGQCFVVLDSPAGEDRDGIVTYVETTASLLNLTEFAAMYWPQVKVLNPNTTVFGNDESIVVPPSGHIAGVYVRTDASKPGGVHKPPAGVIRGILKGVVGFEDESVMEPETRDIVFPKMINPLTTEPGLPLYIDGSRCLNPSGNFPHVAERRGVIYIEQSIKRGLHFARHDDNTPTLRRQVDRTINAFLLLQYNQEAFRGTSPATSFFVDVGDALNPPSEQFAKKLNARVGLATKKPAEFIVLRFSQDTRDYEEELAAAGL